MNNQLFWFAGGTWQTFHEDALQRLERLSTAMSADRSDEAANKMDDERFVFAPLEAIQNEIFILQNLLNAHCEILHVSVRFLFEHAPHIFIDACRYSILFYECAPYKRRSINGSSILQAARQKKRRVAHFSRLAPPRKVERQQNLRS